MTFEAVRAAIVQAWAGTSGLEAAGAVLGLAYLVLVIGQYRGAWLAALASTALYLVVFWTGHYYLQAALQVYYIAIAAYGWWAWRRRADGAQLPVTRAGTPLQLAGLAAVAVVSAATATWLARETGSSDPWLDSLTTWASVFATGLVARKKIDNWAWWLVVDALMAVMCWRGQLYATMLLYVSYLGLVLIGWRSWALDMQRSATAGA